MSDPVFAPASAAAAEPAAEKKRAVVKVSSLTQLSEIIRAPYTVQIEFGTQLVQLQVQGIPGELWERISRVSAEVKPPNKVDKMGKVIAGEYNEDDPEYLKKASLAFEMKRTAALDAGLVGMPIPGETLEEKHEWRMKYLTPQAVDMLYGSITALTKDPIALAHFITDAG